MCGRFTLSALLEQIIERFEVQIIEKEVPVSYNIAPSQPVDVITVRDGVRVLSAFRWGLVPSWSKGPSSGAPLINARAETLAAKPSFRPAFLQRRCLIPATGFYEWQGQGKAKQPMLLQIPGSELFAFAGLWEEWRSPDGSMLRSCCIVTTEANDNISDIHERMPVMLRPEDEAAWLDPSCQDIPLLQNLLKPFHNGGLTFHPVSTLINSPGYNSPACLEPFVAEEVVEEQPSLF